MYGASNTDFEYRDPNLGTGTGDSGTTKNSLKASAVINGVAVNHLYNGGFELGSGSSVYGWVKSSSNIGWGDSYWYSNSRILCVPVGTYVYQDVMLASGTYTLSADCFTDSDGSKVTLKASSGSTVWGSQTYTLYNTMDTYNALSPTLTFTITSAQTVRITIEVTGGSSSSNPVYMDNVMLENNIGAGSFNAIQFGGFTDTYADSNTASGPLSHWSTTYANTAIESNKGLQGDGLRITGNVNQYQWISQRVAVTSPTLISGANSNSAVDIALRRSRTFTVSGFAKAMAQIANEEAYFSIEVDIYYVGDTDGSPSKTLYFDFNKEITDWQFLSGTFTTASNRILQYIDVNLTYAYQPGTAYFDNISLVEEKGNDTANYAYNANGLPEFTYTPADCVYYEYDSNKNLVFAYDSQGNGHYSQYSGKVLLSETTFQYDNKSFNLLDWYLNGHTKTGANLIDQLTYTVISKTV